jgi:hypothetical protein
MTEPFDPAALLMVLDATEAAGAPPEMVDQLRGMVARLPTVEERLAEAEALAVRQVSRLTQLETRDYLEARQSAYDRQCAVGGPWRHVAIDEHHRGSPNVVVSCERCNREPSPPLMALDDPPPIVRRRRHSYVNLLVHRFSSWSQGDPTGRDSEVSPAIHVGRCEACGTWHVG